jgi:spermidine/putrescine transport system permease protein
MTAPPRVQAPAAPEHRRPMSLTAGAELSRGLSGVGAVLLVLAVFGLSIRRYAVSGTSLNFAGPAFGFCMLILLVLALIAVGGVRAATRVLADDTGARDQLVGLGFGNCVVSALVAVKLFVDSQQIAAWFFVVWAALAIVAIALLSTAEASRWLEGRFPALNVLTWIRSNGILFFAALVMAFLYIPNVVVAAMSFNYEQGKHTTYQWYGFTTSNWTHICAQQGMCSSVVTSLWIGAVATVGATLIGTLAAFGLMRHRFVGREASNTILFLPMATPDIVMGSSLLAFFIAIHAGGHLGYITIIIAHVMFCLSYVVVTVKARLSGMDATLQQAAMDLYANESQTFWKVTFPLIFPGILAAALLSFSLSFDDYIITNLNAGTVTTFPVYVWGAALRGLPMQVNVIGTIMFLLAIFLVLSGEVFSRRRARARS